VQDREHVAPRHDQLNQVVWLTTLLRLDLILLGVMAQGRLTPDVAVCIAPLNPPRVSRTAAMATFDRQLIVFGPLPLRDQDPAFHKSGTNEQKPVV
jgi:hypothetical protein